jgi:LacI family transcriptional regulator
VAALSGVHYSTVSRALSESSDRAVAPATRERVLLAARQLGYRPNAIAQGLRTARTATIGMVIPTFRNPVWAEVTRGAFQRAWERGVVLVLVEDDAADEVEAPGVRLVRQSRVDGLLIASYQPGDRTADWLLQEVPTCYVGRQKVGSGRNVTLDEYATGQLVAARLAELGHRRAGHITGPGDNEWLARRAAGFVEECRRRGVHAVVTQTSLDEAGGLAATDQLLGMRHRVTALFVTNFNQTFGAMASIRAHGLAVPADISFVTSDDDPVMAYLETPLTAVHRPLGELGAAAVDALMEQLEDNVHHDVTLQTPAVLVERASLAPPP